MRAAAVAHGDPTCWHAFKPHPGRADVARYEISTLGYPTFSPRLVLRHTKTEHVEVDLFQPYCFVRFDLAEPWGKVKHTRGVRSLICNTEGKPLTVDPVHMALLLAHPIIWADTAAPDLAGSEIEVLDGPLARFRGLVSSVHADRVSVLFSMFGAERQVSMPARNVRLVDA